MNYYIQWDTFKNILFYDILQLHEGIKAYKCKLCPQAYGQSQELKKHLNTFHRKDNFKE